MSFDFDSNTSTSSKAKRVLYVQSCGDVGAEAFYAAGSVVDEDTGRRSPCDPTEKLTVEGTLVGEPDKDGRATIEVGDTIFEARERDDSGRQPGTWRFAD